MRERNLVLSHRYGQVPFECEWLGANNRFRMSSDVANMILALAVKGAGGSPIAEWPTGGTR